MLVCFASILMAGLDGIQNKIHPGDAVDKNLYDLPPAELKGIPTVGAIRYISDQSSELPSSATVAKAAFLGNIARRFGVKASCSAT